MRKPMNEPSVWTSPSTLIAGFTAFGVAFWGFCTRWFSLVRRDELAETLEKREKALAMALRERNEQLDGKFRDLKDVIEDGRLEAQNGRSLLYARMGALEQNVAHIKGRLGIKVETSD